MAAELRSASQGQTMVLTISNPEHRNALGPDIYAAGVEALNAADSSPEVRSVVITGDGGLFSAGGNLQRLLANRLLQPDVQARGMEGKLAAGITGIDYGGFVDLVAEHSNNQSWL